MCEVQLPDELTLEWLWGKLFISLWTEPQSSVDTSDTLNGSGQNHRNMLSLHPTASAVSNSASHWSRALDPIFQLSKGYLRDTSAITVVLPVVTE